MFLLMAGLQDVADALGGINLANQRGQASIRARDTLGTIQNSEETATLVTAFNAALENRKRDLKMEDAVAGLATTNQVKG